jgi:hypothetical protein
MRVSARAYSLDVEKPIAINPDPDVVRRRTMTGVLDPDSLDPQTFISLKSFLNPHSRAHPSAHPPRTNAIVS